ncbi:hypothetical protein Fcan01_24412 [Folsomia candida]|uniref:Uncharacterized protein n=1 Tax=Folsomia candida TaxID=158441 RepID=A0A226D592_FOLCA|nr:hypothetical protein Fcan01_24412 [Folsomia candida]
MDLPEESETYLALVLQLDRNGWVVGFVCLRGFVKYSAQQGSISRTVARCCNSTVVLLQLLTVALATMTATSLALAAYGRSFVNGWEALFCLKKKLGQTKGDNPTSQGIRFYNLWQIMTIVLYQFYFNFFILVPCNLFLNLDAIGYIIHISHLPPLLYWPSQIVRSNIITASVFECLRQYPLIFFLCLSFMTTLGAILEELAVCVKKRKEVKSSLIIYATLRLIYGELKFFAEFCVVAAMTIGLFLAPLMAYISIKMRSHFPVHEFFPGIFFVTVIFIHVSFNIALYVQERSENLLSTWTNCIVDGQLEGKIFRKSIKSLRILQIRGPIRSESEQSDGYPIGSDNDPLIRSDPKALGYFYLRSDPKALGYFYLRSDPTIIRSDPTDRIFSDRIDQPYILQLTAVLSKATSQPKFTFEHVFEPAILSVMWDIVAGKRSELDDAGTLEAIRADKTIRRERALGVKLNH